MTEFFNLILLLLGVAGVAQAISLWADYSHCKMGYAKPNRFGFMFPRVVLRFIAILVAVAVTWWAYVDPEQIRQALGVQAFVAAVYFLYMTQSLQALEKQRELRYFDLAGPGFSLTDKGITIHEVNVVDTLQVSARDAVRQREMQVSARPPSLTG